MREHGVLVLEAPVITTAFHVQYSVGANYAL